MASMSLLARKRRYPNPEKHEQKYFEISRDLGAESGLLKSVLRSCFIGGIDENAPAIKVIIDAPDRFSMDLLNGKYRGKLIEIASQKYQKPVEIFFVSGRDSEDNCL